MRDNGSIYFMPIKVGLRVWKVTRYGRRSGVVSSINPKTISITWDSSFSARGETRQRVSKYELTSIFPERAVGGGNQAEQVQC